MLEESKVLSISLDVGFDVLMMRVLWGVIRKGEVGEAIVVFGYISGNIKKVSPLRVQCSLSSLFIACVFRLVDSGTQDAPCWGRNHGYWTPQLEERMIYLSQWQKILK